MDLHNLLENILDHACPTTEDADGVQTFWIETHCVGWWIKAQMVEGVWKVHEARPEAC